MGFVKIHGTCLPLQSEELSTSDFTNGTKSTTALNYNAKEHIKTGYNKVIHNIVYV